jgi:hypothetical protein
MNWRPGSPSGNSISGRPLQRNVQCVLQNWQAHGCGLDSVGQIVLGVTCVSTHEQCLEDIVTDDAILWKCRVFFCESPFYLQAVQIL